MCAWMVTDASEKVSAYVSDVSGQHQVHVLDRETGNCRQLTDFEFGTTVTTITPNGKFVWAFDQEAQGTYFGGWKRVPIDGGEALEIDEVPRGKTRGIAVTDDVAVIGISDAENGHRVFSWRDGRATGLFQHENMVWVKAVSPDGKYAAIDYSPGRNEFFLTDAGVIDIDDPSRIISLSDNENGCGTRVRAIGFAPKHGDPRLLVEHERGGKKGLLIWNTETNITTEIDIPELSEGFTGNWYPNGEALAILVPGRINSELYRYELKAKAGKNPTPLPVDDGIIYEFTPLADGAVEYRQSSAVNFVRHKSTARNPPPFPSQGESVPPSVPLEEFWVPGPAGDIHTLVARPESSASTDGSHPMAFMAHGGPGSIGGSSSVLRSALVDLGFVVIHANYRGANGYGDEWRDAIKGRPGLVELEDIAAIRQWAVETGLADPERCLITGGSWGGNLTCLALGTQPDLWAAGVAFAPICDFVDAYNDRTIGEDLKALYRELFGGTPEDAVAREAYIRGSAITHARNNKAPLLLVAGRNDRVCPLRQIKKYRDALEAHGKPHELLVYEAGHGLWPASEDHKRIPAVLRHAVEHVRDRDVAGRSPNLTRGRTGRVERRHQNDRDARYRVGRTGLRVRGNRVVR